MNPRLGFRSVSDPRDSKYPLSALMGKRVSTAPRKKLLFKSYKLGSILDQGNTSACVGHACKLMLTSEPWQQKDTPSPFTIYREARVIDEFPDDSTEGTSVRAGLKVLQNRGLIKNYYWAQDAEHAVDFVHRISPLVVGTQWFSGMNTVNAEGFVDVRGDDEGGHSYLACGVSLEKNAILFANSWGVQFGFSGLFWMKIADFAKLLHNGGCAAAVQEK